MAYAERQWVERTLRVSLLDLAGWHCQEPKDADSHARPQLLLCVHPHGKQYPPNNTHQYSYIRGQQYIESKKPPVAVLVWVRMRAPYRVHHNDRVS